LEAGETLRGINRRSRKKREGEVTGATRKDRAQRTNGPWRV